MADEFEACPRFTLELPPLPPRSRLYPLAPIGLGTPLVESLSSYLSRLVRAHRVSMRALARFEIAPLLARPYAPGTVCSMFQEQDFQLNGRGQWARQIVEVLEQLTGRPELRFLMMWRWQRAFHGTDLLRRTQAWCPACYQNWQQTGQLVYNPLLWVLKPVRLCVHHGQPLQEQCPTCQSPVSVMQPTGRLGYCPGCGGWLGRPARPESTTPQALWQAEVLGELLAAAPHVTGLPTRAGMRPVLTAYIERVAPGNISAVAAQIGLTPHRLRAYLTNLGTMQVQPFLEVCYRLGLRPLQCWVTAAPPPTVGSPRPADLQQVRQTLEAVIAQSDTPPLTLAEVARRLKTHPSSLRPRFPDLCEAIVKRHQAYQAHEKMKLQQALEAILTGAETPPPTVMEVSHRLNLSESRLRNHFPGLCNAITEQHRSYQITEKKRIGTELQAILDGDESPPPPLKAITQRLAHSEDWLRHWFPELCQGLVEKRRQFYRRKKLGRPPAPTEGAPQPGPSMTQAEVLKLRADLVTILTGEALPAPLTEISRQLGWSVAAVQQSAPDLAEAISERRRQAAATALARLRGELETILTESEPLPLRQVAQRLGTSDDRVMYHFPDLAQAIVARHQQAQQASRWQLQGELERIIARHDLPPPSLNEVARQLGKSSQRLVANFPELCQVIKDRYYGYLQAEKTRGQQGLEAVLADETTLPPPLYEVAHQLGLDHNTICDWFPELCQALLARRQAAAAAEKLKLQQALEAILANEDTPPPSWAAVCRHLGYGQAKLRGRFPELSRRIAARYASYQQEQLQHQLAQACVEVREITFQLYQEGMYPCFRLVLSRACQPGNLEHRAVRAVWQQAKRELGLQNDERTVL